MKKILVLGLLISNLLWANQMVYVVNSKKYHISKECRTLKKANNIKAISIENKGSRTACKVCL
ncbi:MAG: hypothetical protein ACRCZO_08220 [Cetobacterium sp.]|uniref:hypothetical protein n=1 Tax=Cetobacterium sp. TaxID=2071632 RepID=UPI003F31DC1B